MFARLALVATKLGLLLTTSLASCARSSTIARLDSLLWLAQQAHIDLNLVQPQPLTAAHAQPGPSVLGSELQLNHVPEDHSVQGGLLLQSSVMQDTTVQLQAVP